MHKSIQGKVGGEGGRRAWTHIKNVLSSHRWINSSRSAQFFHHSYSAPHLQWSPTPYPPPLLITSLIHRQPRSLASRACHLAHLCCFSDLCTHHFHCISHLYILPRPEEKEASSVTVKKHKHKSIFCLLHRHQRRTAEMASHKFWDEAAPSRREVIGYKV